jgi:hypothetical protein
MGPNNKGHVRYPSTMQLLNTEIKGGKRENLMGNPPLKVHASK